MLLSFTDRMFLKRIFCMFIIPFVNISVRLSSFIFADTVFLLYFVQSWYIWAWAYNMWEFVCVYGSSGCLSCYQMKLYGLPPRVCKSNDHMCSYLYYKCMDVQMYAWTDISIAFKSTSFQFCLGTDLPFLSLFISLSLVSLQLILPMSCTLYPLLTIHLT